MNDIHLSPPHCALDELPLAPSLVHAILPRIRSEPLFSRLSSKPVQVPPQYACISDHASVSVSSARVKHFSLHPLPRPPPSLRDAHITSPHLQDSRPVPSGP